MKKLLLLSTAFALYTGACMAQITTNSQWICGYASISCKSASDNTIKLKYESVDDEEEITLNKVSNNKFTVKSTAQYSNFTKTPYAEYRVVDGHKLILFKDAKGNIISTYEPYNPANWYDEIKKGYYLLLEGEYIDDGGVKYSFKGNKVTMGNNTSTFDIDPERFYIINILGADYWWKVSTTGINLYHIQEGEYGEEPGAPYHKLREISPNGRWPFLSTQIVPDHLMWRYPSGIIRLMRNEIYARHGYVFNSADLKKYFGSQSWYKPINNNASIKLSNIESLNVDILKSNETAAREGTDDEEIEEGY